MSKRAGKRTSSKATHHTRPADTHKAANPRRESAVRSAAGRPSTRRRRDQQQTSRRTPPSHWKPDHPPPPELTAHHSRTGAPPMTSLQTDPGDNSPVTHKDRRQQTPKRPAEYHTPSRRTLPTPRQSFRPTAPTSKTKPHPIREPGPPVATMVQQPQPTMAACRPPVAWAAPPRDCQIPPEHAEVSTAQVSPREKPQAAPPNGHLREEQANQTKTPHKPGHPGKTIAP
ncbi:uncharacterized protein LOC129185304 [Dunckerocampus dactyliophorus]|uniref:uncharacterized protein LOC129185304 n=1 Tax=Dunckerocampus dactyliophorus TaxID=161453 RepID=UPI002405AB14|nr:uncharacterized protein LOC129185304 [Dunckerocampus dactyliophorus]